MEEYSAETPSIDCMNSHIQEKVRELRAKSGNDLDYIKQDYIFVRDDMVGLSGLK